MTPWNIAKDSEDSHQAALFCWANTARRYGLREALIRESYNVVPQGHFIPQPCLQLLHAIPNGGKRDARTAAKLKATGVKSGVYDVFLPVARCGFHGLYVEMKKESERRKKNGGLRDEQIGFGHAVREQGYATRVAYHWLEAVVFITEYLTHKMENI